MAATGAGGRTLSHETLLHRLVRPPVLLCARWRLTPNQLTGLRLFTGLAAALLFAAGGRGWPAVGAGMMLLSLLLDRADGQLARVTGRVSAAGRRYDLWADGVCTVAVFVGMGVGSQARWGAAALLFGTVAAGSVVALFLLTQALEPADRASSTRPFDPDDALLATPFLVWLGLMPWAVLVAAVVSPLAAVALTAVLLLKRRAAAAG